MGKEFPRKRALKQLPTTRVAELATRPGRLPKTRKDSAFLYRARKGDPKTDPRATRAASRLFNQTVWAQVAESALLALQRLFGISTARSQVRSVGKGRLSSPRHGARVDLVRAHGMLHALMDFLRSAASERIAAQIILTEKGELKADEGPKDIRQAGRFREERPTEIYAKPTFYTDNPFSHIPR